jgi:hypothetical protein
VTQTLQALEQPTDFGEYRERISKLCIHITVRAILKPLDRHEGSKAHIQYSSQLGLILFTNTFKTTFVSVIASEYFNFSSVDRESWPVGAFNTGLNSS